MMKKIKIILLNLVLLFNFEILKAMEEPDSSETFRSEQRPLSVKANIEKKFKKLQSNLCLKGELLWAFNGAEQYYSDVFNERAIIRSLLEGEAGDVYFLDIGAGHGARWAKSLALFVNDLNRTGKTYIISLGAEPVEEAEQKNEIGNCIVYNFGKLNVENLQEELTRRGFGDVKYKGIVTRWCLTHLVDGFGSFDQARRLLAPNGLMMMDSFMIVTSQKEATFKKSGIEAQDLKPLFSALNSMGISFVSPINGLKFNGQGIPFLLKANGKSLSTDLICYDSSPELPLCRMYAEDPSFFRPAVYRTHFPEISEARKIAYNIHRFLESMQSMKRNILTNDKDFYEEMLGRGFFTETEDLQQIFVEHSSETE